MKLLTNYTKLTSLAVVAVFALFTSCMPGPADNPSIVEVGVQVSNVSDTLTAGNDSLKVSEVRLIHGRSSFRTADSTLVLNLPSQLTFPNQRGGNIVSILRPSPFPKNVYQGLTFKVVRADSVKIDKTPPRYSFDPDNIFTDGGNYSIIVDGTLNGEDFTLKISKDLTYKLGFMPPIQVTSQDQRYLFLISTNIEDWFARQDSAGFLDPQTEKEAIIANIAKRTTFTIKQPLVEQ